MTNTPLTDTILNRPPNKKQRAILNLLYRFRFATSEQLSKTLGITKDSTNKRLKLMLSSGYIGRRYEPSYHAIRKHATYFLPPGGIDELKKISKQKYLSKVLRNIANDSTASEQFVSHQLAVYDIYNVLRARYGDSLQFFTKTQMAGASYFPTQKPDAHIQVKVGDEDEPKLFLLDLLHQHQPFFLATRAVIRHITYERQDQWPSQHAFPALLLVCDSLPLQKRLIKKMQFRLGELHNPNLRFYITTLDGLKHDEWRDMAKQDSPLPLQAL